MKGKVSHGRVAVSASVVALLGLVTVAFGAKLTTKVKTVPLPPDDEPHSVTAKCPKASKASGGGFQVRDPSTDLAGATYPTARRKWTSVASRSSLFKSGSELTVAVRCLKDARVKTRSKTAPLPGDENPHSVTAVCPKGTKVAGGGIRLADPGDNILGTFPAGKRKWTAVANRGSVVSSELTAIARCLEDVKVTARSETGPLLDDETPHTVTARCPKGTRVLGGGAETGPTAGSVRGSYPVGVRRWRTIGRVIAVGDIELTAHVLCLKKR